MARALDAYYDRELVGQLVQDDDGQMTFQYGESWLGKPDPVPVSYSLPLRDEPYTQKECRAFFGGMLPEEDNRRIIARILGISDKNDFAMLERIGGECAGAISFLPEGEPIPEVHDRYHELNEDELARILRELPRRPLMVGEDGIRLSLAGVQDKIAVHIDDGTISVPCGSAPSSHVLKSAIDTYDGVVFNEAFCMTLARACGLTAASVEIGRVDDIDYLLVERYDRARGEDGQIERLHQEDFCQALGIPSEIKYQSEGGPSLAACFDLLRKASSTPAPDIVALLDAVIFNLLIGNHDAQGKNFSLLYRPDRTVRLAPLYDLVSTVIYPELTPRMAMKIGKQQKSALVYPRDFDQFAADAGLGAALTRARVPALAERILDEMPGIDKSHPVSEAVASLVMGRCKESLSRFGRK
jgi:serine/threonine-protein kinase HipA